MNVIIREEGLRKEVDHVWIVRILLELNAKIKHSILNLEIYYRCSHFPYFFSAWNFQSYRMHSINNPLLSTPSPLYGCLDLKLTLSIHAH